MPGWIRNSPPKQAKELSRRVRNFNSVSHRKFAVLSRRQPSCFYNPPAPFRWELQNVVYRTLA
jgi:hypothetical protein